jgi:pyruvate dehydrogenase E2 component (dihydrolipoamide acetyltransferase)
VGRIKPRPVVVGDQVVARPTVWLSLTFDHRLVDGGPAARFLQRVVQLVERPHLLIA